MKWCVPVKHIKHELVRTCSYMYMYMCHVTTFLHSHTKLSESTHSSFFPMKEQNVTTNAPALTLSQHEYFNDKEYLLMHQQNGTI